MSRLQRKTRSQKWVGVPEGTSRLFSIATGEWHSTVHFANARTSRHGKLGRTVCVRGLVAEQWSMLGTKPRTFVYCQCCSHQWLSSREKSDRKHDVIGWKKQAEWKNFLGSEPKLLMTSEERYLFGIDGCICTWKNWNILPIKCLMYQKLIRTFLEGTSLSKFRYQVFQKITLIT